MLQTTQSCLLESVWCEGRLETREGNWWRDFWGRTFPFSGPHLSLHTFLTQASWGGFQGALKCLLRGQVSAHSQEICAPGNGLFFILLWAGGSLRTPQVGNSLAALMDSAQSCAHRHDLLPWEDAERTAEGQRVGWSPREPGTCSQSALPGESPRTCWTPTVSHVAHQGTQCPGVLLGDRHMSTLCLPQIQIPRLPGGKQVFSIIHAVCTNSLGSGSHSDQFQELWGLPKSKFTGASRGPALEAAVPGAQGLGPSMLTFFCTCF